MTSFIILELTSAKIELVEDFPCDNKEQLLQREGYYIRNNNCVNKFIPGRTKEENFKIKQEYDKQYREQNIDIIKEKKKIYDKQYRDANREELNKKNREYHQRKKEQALMLNEDININKI